VADVETVTQLYVHECRVAPGTEWTPSSTGWTVVLGSRGFFYWIGQGTAREVNAGDVIVIGPGARGVLRASLIGEPLLHYFSFRPEHLGGLMSLTERLSLQGFAVDEFVRIIPGSHAIAREFMELVMNESARRGFLLRCRILHLVGLIFGEAETFASGQADPHLSTSELRFEQIIERIPDSDLMTTPSEKLAAMCGCSARHFRRLFRKRFKTSIRSKQTELRLEKARQLLAETNEKVVVIALESGYRHLGLFNATFKKKFRMTPTEWRRASA